MKIKNIITVLLVAFILASCAPAAKVVPTETAISTLTFTPVPTATITSTPIPTIEVEGRNIPDPHFSNPEFFDFNNADSLIVQFANAFGIKPELVSIGLRAKIETPNRMPAYAVIRTSDGVALMMATQNAEGEWAWEKATPGTYWRAQGKEVGVSLTWDEFNSSQRLIERYFSEGMMVTETQMLPLQGRTPADALPLAKDAHNNNMSIFYHYVAEPGKFPPEINSETVDGWINSRFDGLINLIMQQGVEGRLAYINFNEAWLYTTWNLESNPLRDKYGEQWVEEYTYKLLDKFVNAGLVPNQDFMILFNEGDLYTHTDKQRKQELMLTVLTEARANAFNRLIANSETKDKLADMDITTPEDIHIMIGATAHMQLDLKADSVDLDLMRPPTDDEVIEIVNNFAPLGGGIMLTEMNPMGSPEQQHEFVARIFRLMKNNPDIKGIMLWNVIKDSDDGSSDYPLSGGRLILFDEQGFPTSLYYELLR